MKMNRSSYLRYTDPIFVHPTKIPHSECTELRVRCGLIISCSLLQPGLLWLLWDTQTMIIVIAHFNKGVNISLSSCADPLR